MTPLLLLSAIYLISIGEGFSVLFAIGYGLFFTILTALSIRATHPQLETQMETATHPSVLWLQLFVIAVVILLTGLYAFNILGWSDFIALFRTLGENILPTEWFGGPGNAIANPVQYFIIPFILLLCLGVRPAELGLGRGYRIWHVCRIWLAIPVVAWAILLIIGLLPPQILIRRLIANTFQNGFFEEFLFRGALLTRLNEVISTPWSLTIQAVLFGLWHIQANTHIMDGNLLAAIAVCLISQGITGFLYGIIFQRTRNLVAPSIIHVAMNMFGQTFG